MDQMKPHPKSNVVQLHKAIELVVTSLKEQISRGYISPFPYSQILDIVKAMASYEKEAIKRMGKETGESGILYMADYMHLHRKKQPKNQVNNDNND